MSIVFADNWLTVHHGDARAVLPTLAAESIDAVVTDPPYDLTNRVPDVHSCETCGRVLGRDAGATVCPRCGGELSRQRSRQRRGFMSKAWDATGVAFAAATWAAIARVAKPGAWLLAFGGTRTHHRMAVAIEDGGWQITDELAWLYAQGMPKGRTTLKPAHEPILLARKPAKRVTPLQIDESRIPFADEDDEAETKGKNRHVAEGRWPANVVLTDAVLDPGTEDVVFARLESARGHVPASRPASAFQANAQRATQHEARLDSGSYSRFFLIPKAGRGERNAGLEGVAERPLLWSAGTQSPGTFQSAGTTRATRNAHPTVKPIELMSHLVRLVTPRGGAVLDPFAGSGSTAVAAIAHGRRCVAIESDRDYADLIPRRLRLLAAVPSAVPA